MIRIKFGDGVTTEVNIDVIYKYSNTFRTFYDMYEDPNEQLLNFSAIKSSEDFQEWYKIAEYFFKNKKKLKNKRIEFYEFEHHFSLYKWMLYETLEESDLPLNKLIKIVNKERIINYGEENKNLLDIINVSHFLQSEFLSSLFQYEFCKQLKNKDEILKLFGFENKFTDLEKKKLKEEKMYNFNNNETINKRYEELIKTTDNNFMKLYWAHSQMNYTVNGIYNINKKKQRPSIKEIYNVLEYKKLLKNKITQNIVYHFKNFDTKDRMHHISSNLLVEILQYKVIKIETFYDCFGYHVKDNLRHPIMLFRNIMIYKFDIKKIDDFYPSGLINFDINLKEDINIVSKILKHNASTIKHIETSEIDLSTLNIATNLQSLKLGTVSFYMLIQPIMHLYTKPLKYINKFKNLKYLSINCYENLAQDNYFEGLNNLIHFEISNCDSITDKTLSFIKNNNLRVLGIYNCPNISISSVIYLISDSNLRILYIPYKHDNTEIYSKVDFRKLKDFIKSNQYKIELIQDKIKHWGFDPI